MQPMTNALEQAQLAAVLSDASQPSHRRVMAGDALRYALMKDAVATVGLLDKIKVDQAEQVSAEIIAVGLDHLAANEGTSDETMDVYNALERAYITRAPNNFHDYLIALEWKRPAKARFYQPRMKVLREVVDALTDMMVNDRYDFLLLSMPPRVGKSTLGLLFLSWCGGRNPDSPILAVGYAEKITKMFYNGVAEVYADSEYNYRAIFPLIELVNTSAEDLTLDFRDDSKTTTRKYKSLTCRAIEASLTGATEARQVLYIDDLVSGIEEALNINRLLMLRDKLISNVYSRKKEGCKEVHIGTRWSIHDPMGWVESSHAGDPRCKVICVPALDEETDESNFDYPYGVGFTTEFYRILRDVTYANDAVTWQCVYQQKPIEREGLLFPAEDLCYCMELPDIEHNPPDDIFAFCDVAFGGEDYLSMPVAFQWGNDPPIIADAIFLKGGYETTEPIVSGTLIYLGVRRAVFEANAGGDFYSRDVADLVEAAFYRIYITAVRAPSKMNKQSRIVQHSPAIRGFTFLDPKSKDASPMYRQFLTNLTTYTMSSKNQNDDAPDSLAGLAAMMRMNLNATATVYDRKHI